MIFRDGAQICSFLYYMHLVKLSDIWAIYVDVHVVHVANMLGWLQYTKHQFTAKNTKRSRPISYRLDTIGFFRKSLPGMWMGLIGRTTKTAKTYLHV